MQKVATVSSKEFRASLTLIYPQHFRKKKLWSSFPPLLIKEESRAAGQLVGGSFWLPSGRRRGGQLQEGPMIELVTQSGQSPAAEGGGHGHMFNMVRRCHLTALQQYP